MLTALLAGLVIGGVGYAVYLLIVFKAVPGSTDEGSGQAALPADLGVWREDGDSPEGRAAAEQGERRQVRLWLYPDRGLFGRSRLVRQVRYQSLATGRIERVEPEVPVELPRPRT